MKALLQRIEDRSARIGIIGLGYVGLPLAVEFGKAGFSVTGFEVDPAKPRSIAAGKSYIGDIPSSAVAALRAAQRLTATTDFTLLKGMDAVIICVPTPLRKSKDPDVSYIVTAGQAVARTLRRGQLIVLESTTYPGTTRDLMLPFLERKSLRCGKDYFLAFSPERVDPGNKRHTITNTPKVVGGITAHCGRLAAALYGAITAVHPVSSPEAAEMVKLLENTFRAVNIGLVNEVALMCDRLKLNVWEIIDAAATKPFGYIPFYPGPGIGGHCIPLDPHYLSWKLKTLNFYARFIELAAEINSRMPEYLVAKIVEALNERGKPIVKAKVLILGVAYKKDVGDVRESPALDVVHLLVAKKAVVSYFDPLIPSFTAGGTTLRSIPDLKRIAAYDAVVIVTDHTGIDYMQVVKHAALVVDSRNATKGCIAPKIIRL